MRERNEQIKACEQSRKRTTNANNAVSGAICPPNQFKLVFIRLNEQGKRSTTQRCEVYFALASIYLETLNAATHPSPAALAS